MAHEIESMAYRSQKPWHGIGTDLPPNQSVETWIEASGMNFKYLASPVSFFDDIGNCQTFPEQKVLYRSDNRTPMSVVSKRYNVVQPREIIDFYSDLVDVFGFQLETAGVLRSGKKIWALAKTGHHGNVRGNDPVNGYLLLATACDGTLATTAQFTSVRVVCHNTLAVALKSDGQSVKVPHMIMNGSYGVSTTRNWLTSKSRKTSGSQRNDSWKVISEPEKMRKAAMLKKLPCANT